MNAASIRTLLLLVPLLFADPFAAAKETAAARLEKTVRQLEKDITAMHGLA